MGMIQGGGRGQMRQEGQRTGSVPRLDEVGKRSRLGSRCTKGGRFAGGNVGKLSFDRPIYCSKIKVIHPESQWGRKARHQKLFFSDSFSVFLSWTEGIGSRSLLILSSTSRDINNWGHLWVYFRKRLTKNTHQLYHCVTCTSTSAGTGVWAGSFTYGTAT